MTTPAQDTQRAEERLQESKVIEAAVAYVEARLAGTNTPSLQLYGALEGAVALYIAIVDGYPHEETPGV